MSDLLWPGDERAGALLTDAHLLDAMLRVEAAWSQAGALPAEAAVDADRLRALLRDGDLEAVADGAEASGTPVVPLLRLLRSRLGDTAAARWLHRGLTSQDVVDTALLLCAREAVAVVLAELAEQVRLLARLVETHRSAPQVARTLAQHAVPTTLGLTAGAWLAGVLDARDDLAAVRLPVQLGGAAGTMAAAVEITRDAGTVVAACHEVARSLGLEPAPPWHVVRSPVTRLGDALVRCTDAWGHLAGDVVVLSRPEVAELAEGSGGGSSTMPHKANPVLSVLLRRAALTAPPLAATLHTAAATTTDQRGAGTWQAEWSTLRVLLRRTVVAAAQATRLLDGLQLDPARAAATLEAAEGVRSEQETMAGLTGRPPAPTYVGATDAYVDAVLTRAREVLP